MEGQVSTDDRHQPRYLGSYPTSDLVILGTFFIFYCHTCFEAVKRWRLQKKTANLELVPVTDASKPLLNTDFQAEVNRLVVHRNAFEESLPANT